MDFNWHIIRAWWPNILQALGITVAVFLVAGALAILLGLAMGALSTSKKKSITFPVRAYVSIFRNTPLLVQLFFLFYGLPALGIRMSPFTTGILGIALNEGAFMAEIFRGNIQAVDNGDWEAAESLALTRFQTLLYVILPQAVRDAIPAVTGQLSIVIKDTSLLSLIMIVELTRVSNQIYTRLFDLTGFSIALILYILMNIVMTSLAKYGENRFRIRR
ncbi:MAG: amino acid ABC transporter permease [Desulfobacterales bacterium]|nr:amino acid ABC transporter permease [Desulfobacterales bacterium]